MKRLRNILLLLIISINSFGTAQYGDILIWNGDTLALFSNPLESHPEIGKLRFEIESKFEEQDRLMNPEKYESDEVEVVEMSTACWREYIAEWIVIEKEIYLNNIYSCLHDNVKANLNEIFPEIIVNGKIKADWITEELYVPSGECLEYVHFDYESIYEFETVLNVENGFVIDIKKHNNSVKKSSLNLNEIIYKNLDWNKFSELEEKFVQVNVIIQPTEKGKLEHIIDCSIVDGWKLLDKENEYKNEAIRLIKLIPEFDVYIRRDKVLELSISVFFDKKHMEQYAR